MVSPFNVLPIEFSVCYLKIVNTFSKTYLEVNTKLTKELINGIEILVGQAVLSLRVNQQLKNWLTFLNFNVIFDFLGQFSLT